MSECVELLLSGPNEYTAYQQIASSTPDEKNLPDELLRIFHENAGSILNDFDALNFLAWFFLGSILHFPDSGLMTSMQMSDIQVKFDHMTKSIKLAFLKQNADQQIKVILRSISFNSKDPAKFTDQELNELTYKWNVQYFQLFTFEFDTQHLEILTQYDHFSLQRYFSVQWRNDVDKSELLSKMEKLTRKKVAMEIMNEKVDAQVGTFFQIERNEESKFAETLAQFSIPNPLKVKNNAQLLMSKMQNTYGKYRPFLMSVVSNDISYLAYVTGALVMNFQERFALYCTWIPMIHDLQSSMLSVISKYVYNPKLDSNVPLYVTSTNLDTAQKMKRLTTNAGKALLPSYATDSSLAVLSVVNFDLPNQHQISTVEINEGFLNKMLNMYNNPEIHDSIDDVLNVELRFDSELLLNSADSDVFETFLHAQLLALKMPNVKKFKFAHEIPQVTTYALEHGKDMLYLHVHKNYDRDFKNIQHKVFAIGNILEKDDFFNVHIFVGDQSDVFVDKTAKADILARKHTLFTGQVQSMDNIDVPYMLDMLQAQNIHGVKIFTENLFTDYAKQFCKSDAHFRAFLKGIFHPRAVFLSKFEPHSIVAIVPRQISSSENSLTNFLRSPAQNDNILSTGRALLIAYKFLHDESQLSDLVENMSYDFYENYYSRFKFTEHELSPVFMQLISNNGNLVHVSTSRISNGGSRLPSEECGMRRRKRSFSCLTRKSASRIKYLEKLGTAASIGTLALMGKNIVAQVFQGHYLSALVTSSLLITAPLLGIVSHKMAKVASPLVRTAAPFVGKLSSAFVIYDLWQNIKDGSTANILADGTLLILDVAEIGVQLAESFGIIGGVSGILGPVGAALGAVVFIGVDIYTAVHTVEKIQEKIRLTTEERFDEGLRAFFGAPPENRIQKLMQEKEHYQGMFDRTVKFLTENPGLGGYVFPAQNLTNGRWIDEENNYIHMNKERDLGKLGRNRPQLPKNIEFVCFNTPKHPQPAGFGEQFLKFVFHFYDPTYILKNVFLEEDTDLLEEQLLRASCRRAVGVSVNCNKTLLIDMKNGNDLVFGSKFTDNIFLIGNGVKNVTGGLFDDIFIFYGQGTTGHYNGRNGDDTVDFTKYAPEKHKLKMSVWGKFARISGSRIYLLNFENLILRMNKPDILKIDCSVKHVDSMNGDQQNPDVIYVPKSACYYNTSFTVGRKVIIKNYAQFGSFDYVIKQDSDSKIYLKDGSSSRIIFINEIHQIKSIGKLAKTGAVSVKFENHAKIVVYTKFKKMVTFYFGGSVELNIDDSFHKHAFVKNNSEFVDAEFYASLAKKIACSFTVYYPNRLTMQIPNPKSENFSHVIHTDPKNPTLILGHGQDNIYVVDYAGFDMLPNITIMEKGDIVKTRTLDLSSLSNSTMRKIDILRSGQDLILEIDNLGNIILKDQAYKNLHIVYRSFVFEIADDAHLQPLPIMGHADHLILIENDLPCENLSFELRMITQKIDFLKSNQTLILLVENQNTFFDIILPNFYANDAKFIKTLRFQFENRFVDLASVGEDQVTELNDKIEREKLMQRKAFSFDHIPTVIKLGA